MWWRRFLVGSGCVCVLGCSDASEDACSRDEYGTVMVELRRGPASATSPFVGTRQVSVGVELGECLSNYAMEHSEPAQDGVEGSSDVFEAWADGCLCDPSQDDALIDCSVEALSQTLNTQGAVAQVSLRIEYAVTDEELEGKRIPVGPFPKQALTGCEPLVTIGVVTGGPDGGASWEATSFDHATAKVGQSAPVQAFVEPAN